MDGSKKQITRAERRSGRGRASAGAFQTPGGRSVGNAGTWLAAWVPLSLVAFGLFFGCGGMPSGEEPFPTADLDQDGFEAADDCNDVDSTSYPGADEVCDGLDNDCDTDIDEGLDIDNDLDGYSGCPPNAGAADCDDFASAVHPDARESCDGVDQNCDGVVDDGFDEDGDGATSCAELPDCDDLDATVQPGALEICDGADNDCDGLRDNGLGGDAYERNNAVEEASDLGDLETSITVDANLDVPEDEDWYRFVLSSTHSADWIRVRLDSIPEGADYNLAVYGGDQQEAPILLGSSMLSSNTSEQVLVPPASSDSSGYQYFVQVTWASGVYGCPNYRLTAEGYVQEVKRLSGEGSAQ